MASLIEHRMQSRISCRIPLQCASKKTEKPFQATIFNISDDGVYMETGRKLQPGQSIVISSPEQVPAKIDRNLVENNAGIVRWTRPVKHDDHLFYGAGVRFFYPDQEEDLETAVDRSYFCDMCGETITYADLKLHKGIIWMCPRCNEYVDHLPRTLYVNASRYLIGNVL